MNAYYNTFAKRFEANRATMSLSNIKKSETLLARLKSQKLADLLKSSDVDASVMSRALYASEKLIKFVSLTQSVDKINENFYAAFRTAMLCADNNVELLDADIDCAVSSAAIVSDERKHLVFQRKRALTTATEDAQSQQCIDVLRSLNIVKLTARARVYTVQKNTIAVALETALAEYA